MAILPGISTLPFELFLTREDRLTNALRNKPAVALRVVAQRFFQLAAKRGFRERWYVKLRSVQVLRIDHLPVERRIERPRFRGTDQRRCQRWGNNYIDRCFPGLQCCSDGGHRLKTRRQLQKAASDIGETELAR